MIRNTTAFKSTHIRLRKLFAVSLSAAILICVLLLAGCAGGPDVPEHPTMSVESTVLDAGTEKFTGTDSNGRIVWTAIRGSRTLIIEPPEYRDGVMLSRNPAGTSVIINGSPHSPVRFSAGKPQEVAGFYRAGGYTYSAPDGRHDSVGVGPDGTPVLLTPDEQQTWTGPALGGFHIILRDGYPREAIPVRDAVSAVGWNADRSLLVFLVIAGSDGRGYSYGEAGALLSELGATDGLTLDGGGSARLTWTENGRIRSFPAALIRRTAPNFLSMSGDTP